MDRRILMVPKLIYEFFLFFSLSVLVFGCGEREIQPLLPEGNVNRVGEIKVGDAPTDLAFSPDGGLLAIATLGELRIYRMDTLRVVKVIRDILPYSLSFMKDGSLLVGRDNGIIDMYDPVKWTKVKTFGKHVGIISAVASSDDGKLIASGGTDGMIYLFDPVLLKKVREVKYSSGITITSLLFSPNGRLLISGSADGTIRMKDLESGETRKASAHPGGVSGISYMPKEDLLISGGMDGSIALWDPETLEEVKRVYRGDSSILDISHVGGLLAFIRSDGMVIILETGNWSEIASIPIPSPAPVLALSPTEGRVAIGDELGSVFIWNTYSIRPSKTISCGSQVSALAFSPDGSFLVSGGDDGGIRVWKGPNWEEVGNSWEHSARVSSLNISKDSRYIASGSWDGTARIWELQGLKVLYVLKHNAWVHSVSFSQDGLYMATGCGDGSIKVWNTQTGKTVRVFKGGTRRSVAAFSPKEKVLAGGGDEGRISIWSSTTWKLIKSLDPDTKSSPLSISFSSDGKLLGVGYEDGYIRIWDVGAGKLLISIKAYITPVNNIVFMGKYMIASGERNRNVTIWNISTGRPEQVIPGPDWVGGLAVSSDGGTLAVGMYNGVGNIWSLR